MKTTATGASAPLPCAAVPRARYTSCDDGECGRPSCDYCAQREDDRATAGWYPVPAGWNLHLTAWGGAR